jgi:hypothetical protein
MRFGVGSSYMSLRGKGPSGSASVSGLGSGSTIALGGSLAPGLVLGGTIHGVTVANNFEGGPFEDAQVTGGEVPVDASNQATAGMSEVGLLVDWYPQPERGWHAGLSAGFGMSSLVNSADGSVLYGTGAGGMVFGGYDWYLGKDWALGLSLVASGTTKSTLKDKDKDNATTDYRMGAFSVGVQSSLVYF